MKLSLTDRVESTLLKTVTEEKVKIALPPGIDHYYTMEMMDQPQCISKALNYGARLMTNKAMVRLGGLEAKSETLMQVDTLIMAACGTSHYATIYAEHLMRSLGCFDFIRCIKASEISEDDLRFKNPKNAAFLSVSQSGETMDLLIPFRMAERMGMNRINVVNKVNSTLARENNCGVFLNCGRELSVASTKAYIS
jgi:glutamine---fructose-6-phosphate transaminase (isomerizing)